MLEIVPNMRVAKQIFEFVLNPSHRLHLSLWKHDLQVATLWTSSSLVSCCAEHDPPLPVPSASPSYTQQLRHFTSLCVMRRIIGTLASRVYLLFPLGYSLQPQSVQTVVTLG